ncbi:MAG: biotin synthase BioB, partial [Thermodesulfovibrionales bacterium]
MDRTNLNDPVNSVSDVDYSLEISTLREKVLSGNHITIAEAVVLTQCPEINLLDLLSSADKIRRQYFGNQIDLCAIVNSKSGACPEDCAYCAQSSRYKTGVDIYPMLNRDTIVRRAEEARSEGVRRFSIVTSGKKIGSRELKIISAVLQEIRDIGLVPCASLGILSRDELLLLKDNGLDRYHHNIETSERFFPMICSTHTFAERLKTIESAKEVGLSVCSGGIFGMGETWMDRLDMAYLLRDLNVESIPINFLIPINGTPLASRPLLHPFEALRVISTFRFILADRSIRICGGRGH